MKFRPKTENAIIAMESPIEVKAAEGEGGELKQASFSTLFYTGGSLQIDGWDHPVVVDLEGLEYGKVLVANLDHDKTKRVGNFDVVNDGKSLVANGKATAATAARDEVVKSALDGYQWQASLEVRPRELQFVKRGQSVQVNGQQHKGPLYVTRKGTLKGLGFVSHGADDSTSVHIAASAANSKEPKMKKEVRDWISGMMPTLDIDSLTDEEVKNIEADYEGREGTRTVTAGGKSTKLTEMLDARQAEVDRVDDITELAAKVSDEFPHAIQQIKILASQAIDEKWSLNEFRLQLAETKNPMSHTVHNHRSDQRLSSEVIEAAICTAGRLEGVDKLFSDQALQMAHDKFRNGIGLQQLLILAAEANGYRNPYGREVTPELQAAALGMFHPRDVHAAGFSTLSLPNTLANVANKFLKMGWDAVDNAWSRISTVRNVRDFKQITTVSLTGDLQFEQVGATGELKHGTVGETVYTNKADTYGRMFAITRTDIINDDLGALTQQPKRLGRGGALKLNDIFWTAFLNNSSFFTSGNANVSTDTGALGLVGLQQADTVFMKQTDPDGQPLGARPKILLVPTELESLAATLMGSEHVVSGENLTQGRTNVWKGRFEVVGTPYLSNSLYTGYSAVAWYLLADPEEIPVIEVAALNGRVEPVIETADAEFNVLGIQMRGYSDVGVTKQEHRGGVRADGSTAD